MGRRRSSTASCVSGEVVKVKYGRLSGEGFAEIAASRLLTALGFGADRMYWVPHLRCEGCPPFPFHTVWLLDLLHAREAIGPRLVSDRSTDFEWVAIERKHEGETIKSDENKGWAWYELDQIEPARGATRAEVDALRLAAILLAHWDNKSSNQRLVCLDPPPLSTTRPCARPLAMIQDLGSTFGPKKVDLENWKATPIWKDPARCIVSMRQLPYDGGTFPDTQISEAGRRLLARQLSALTDASDCHAVLGARVSGEFNGGNGAAADPNVWARAVPRQGPADCASRSVPGLTEKGSYRFFAVPKPREKDSDPFSISAAGTCSGSREIRACLPRWGSVPVRASSRSRSRAASASTAAGSRRARSGCRRR